MQDDVIDSVEILSAEEGKYKWSFAFFMFESQLELIKWTNQEILKIFSEKDKKIDTELWAEDGRGFKELLEDFKKINKERPMKTYKNPILRFNTRNEWLRKMVESMNLMQGSSLVRDMSLVYLVAVFENYLKNLLTFSFRQKPEALKTCQKNLSYEELLKFSDIDSIREAVIEKEAMVVNEDIEEIREYFQKKFNVDISKLDEKNAKNIQEYVKSRLGLEENFEPFKWENFKERFYRRNIIVHNLGMPNKLYRRKTGYQGNGALKVSMPYLLESLNLFYQISLSIGVAFEMKMEKA